MEHITSGVTEGYANLFQNLSHFQNALSETSLYQYFDLYFGMVWFLFPTFCVWVRLLVFPEYVMFDTILVLAAFASRNVWDYATREWEQPTTADAEGGANRPPQQSNFYWQNFHLLPLIGISYLAKLANSIWNHLARSDFDEAANEDGIGEGGGGGGGAAPAAPASAPAEQDDNGGGGGGTAAPPAEVTMSSSEHHTKRCPYIRVISVCMLTNILTYLLFGKTLIFFNMFFEAVVSAINFQEVNKLFFSKKGFSDPTLAAVRVVSLVLFEVAEWNFTAGLSASLLWTVCGWLALFMYFGVDIIEDDDAFSMLRSEVVRQAHFMSVQDTDRQQATVRRGVRAARDGAIHDAQDKWRKFARNIENADEAMKQRTTRALVYIIGCDLDTWQSEIATARRTAEELNNTGGDVVDVFDDAVGQDTQASFDRMFSSMRETNALGVTLWAKANLKLLDMLLMGAVAFGLGVCTFYGRFADPSPPPPFGLSQVLVDGLMDVLTIGSGAALSDFAMAACVPVGVHVLVCFFAPSGINKKDVYKKCVKECCKIASGAETRLNMWLRKSVEWIMKRFGIENKYFVRKFNRLSAEEKRRFAEATVVTLCRAKLHKLPDMSNATQEDRKRERQATEAVKVNGGILGTMPNLPLVTEAFVTLIQKLDVDVTAAERAAATAEGAAAQANEVREFLKHVLESARDGWAELFRKSSDNTSRELLPEASVVEYATLTPLMWAAKEGDTDAVKKILYTDADPNQATTFPDLPSERMTHTPLHYAAREGHVKVVEVLLDHPRINPNKLSPKDGTTPLHYAAGRRFVDVVKTLLQSKKTIPNPARGDDGATPLHYAASTNDIEMVEVLLDHPRINRQQEAGKSLLCTQMCRTLAKRRNNWNRMANLLGPDETSTVELPSGAEPPSIVKWVQNYLSDQIYEKGLDADITYMALKAEAEGEARKGTPNLDADEWMRQWNEHSQTIRKLLESKRVWRKVTTRPPMKALIP